MSVALQQDLRDIVDRFGRERVQPRVREYDRDEHLPQDLLETMRELGLYGGAIPEEYGGQGLDHVTHAMVIETLSKYDHILGVLASMPSGLVGASVLRYGTAEQKERWLRPLAQGDIFGAAGVTEPHSGTDVAGLTTTYRETADGFVVNGVKAWISNLDIASFFVTFATLDRSLGKAGITAFIIPADTPGVSVRPFKNKLGFRPLSTGELLLDNVELPADALLGEQGKGYDVAMHAVERGRLAVASRAVGVSQACLEAAVRYASQRVVWNQALTEYQMVQKRIADIAVETEAARQLVYLCARVLDDGQRGRREASMAKMFASEVAERSASSAVQIHGAYGASDEFVVGRLYRDAKLLQIVEGANDVHRVLLAKDAFATYA